MNITVISCKNCTFLIDYSRRDCANEPIDTNEITCFDPIPFTINGEFLSYTNCYGLMPFEMDLVSSRYLFFCVFEINADTLFVESMENTTNFEYAILFRVKEWSDVGKKILIMPADREPENPCIALVAPNTIVTVVAHPDAFDSNNGPSFEVAVNFYSIGDQFALPCPFQIETTCNHDMLLNVFSGSTPALLDENQPNFLVRLPVSKSSALRVSVASMFSTSDCTYCLIFTSNVDVDNSYAFLYDEWRHDLHPISLTSYEYPWYFGETQLHEDCFVLQTSYSRYKDEEDPDFQTYDDFLAETNKCQRKVEPVLNISLSSAILNADFDTMGLCFWFQWCPNPGFSYQKGFDLLLTPVYLKDCDLTYFLTDNNPSIVFHGVYFMSHLEDQICFEVENCTNCEPMVVTSRYCSFNETKDGCALASPFNFKNTLADLKCSYQKEEEQNLIKERCTFCLEEKLILAVNGNIDIFQSAIMISKVKFQVDLEPTFTVGAKILTTNAKILALDQRKLVVFALGSTLTPVSNLVLSEFRWSHAPEEMNCEYRFCIGPPRLHENDSLAEPVLTFRDSDVFVPQFLLSDVYTVEIPQFCSPLYSIEPIKDYQRETAILDQNLCEGTALITSAYIYFNELDSTNGEIRRWNLSCLQHPVEIRIESRLIETNTTMIRFDDWQGNVVMSRKLLAGETINETVSGASSILINWTSTETNGYITKIDLILLAHFRKIFHFEIRLAFTEAFTASLLFGFATA
ncbi:unnamed protein product, partial [Mesorhabditis belari]|uniref:Uncharacterized protein n=1 Tax=Mesorhabditis belari TaxID=2138241 RepID=A0AAF3FLX9_9BILA